MESTNEQQQQPEQEAPATEAAEATEATEAPEAPRRPRREPIALEVKAERCEESARRIIELLGVEASEVTVSVEGEQLQLSLGDVTSPTGVDIDSRTYEAVQFFVSKAMNKGAARRTRLQLKAAGFRGRNRDGFGRVAAHLAHKARKLNLSFAVTMSDSGEKEALRGQLAKQSGVAVEGVKEEGNHRLTIAPSASSNDDGGGNGGGRRRRRRRRR